MSDGPDDLSLMRELIRVLEDAGNPAVPPGFTPTQGGMSCTMRHPLDEEIVSEFVSRHARLVFVDDQVADATTWSTILGADAAGRALEAYRRTLDADE